MPKLTEAQERERESWQYRAIQLLRGNQTLPGTILLSAMGRVASNPPILGLHAVIDENGIVHADFVDRDRRLEEAVPIIRAEVLANAFRIVAERLKLNDEETVELFNTIRGWISKDLRAINNIEGDHD